MTTKHFTIEGFERHLTVAERCREESVQACHQCLDFDCGDNRNEDLDAKPNTVYMPAGYYRVRYEDGEEGVLYMPGAVGYSFKVEL